jgi:hypothetical protein
LLPLFKWYRFFIVFKKQVKIERKLNCSSAHRRFFKMCHNRNLQPIKLSGCKNAPIRDEKAKYSAQAV